MFADDLKRIAMSAELARTLSRAAEYARAQAHNQIELEHLLLALSEDPDAAVVLTASHVDANLLKADVSQYLGGLTDRIDSGEAQPTVAPDLKRILEAAAAAAAHGRRRDINGAIVLAAIVGDGKSPAAHMLRAQGLTFDEAIRALQRAMAQPPAQAQIAAPASSPAHAAISAPTYPAAGAEDAIAAARERIRRSRGIEAHATPSHVSEPVLEPSEPAQPLPVPQPEPATEAGWDEGGFAETDAADSSSESGSYYDTAAAPQPLPNEVPAQGFHDPYAAPQSPRTAYDGRDEFTAPRPEVYGTEQAFEARASAPALSEPPQARVRGPMPSPGSRWPAPVAPAWRDAETALPPSAMPPPVPPPLPYTEPSLEPQFAQPFEPDFQGGQPPGSWDAPAVLPSEFGPAGIHPVPIQQAAEPAGAQLHQQYEPQVGAEPSTPEGGIGPYERGPQTVGPRPSLDGPASRPRRGRKQAEAAARSLGSGLPRRLRLGIPVTVEAKLPKSEIFVLASALSGTPGRAPQPGLAMSVRLRAPDGAIVIDAASSETHWFDARPDVIQSESAHWQWTVTAVEPGRPRLQLIAAIRATGADGITGDHMLPDTLIEARVRGGFGRAMLGLFKWAFAIALGAGAGFYGPVLWAAVHTMIK